LAQRPCPRIRGVADRVNDWCNAPLQVRRTHNRRERGTGHSAGFPGQRGNGVRLHPRSQQLASKKTAKPTQPPVRARQHKKHDSNRLQKIAAENCRRSAPFHLAVEVECRTRAQEGQAEGQKVRAVDRAVAVRVLSRLSSQLYALQKNAAGTARSRYRSLGHCRRSQTSCLCPGNARRNARKSVPLTVPSPLLSPKRRKRPFGGRTSKDKVVAPRRRRNWRPGFRGN